MASTFNNQVPYETTKDCSQGFCSIYCPQWCYIIFPPPPPFSFDDDDDNSSGRPTLSPLVIAIIGILASAFLLVSYYTIISKYCGGSFRRRRAHRNHLGPDDGDVGDDIVSQSRLHEAWHVSPSNGLDEALINKIVVCKYKRGDGLVDSTDCSVCLSEFREDDSLRLLPKCSHAFHLQCIDTWLKSHSNCPLCRANIVLMNPAPAQLPPTTPAPGTNEPNYEMVVVIEDLERGGGGGGEETDLRNDGDASSKEPSGSQDENHGITEIRDDDGVQPIRRSFSMDCLHQSTVSIADILQMNNEDEYFVAKDHELLVGGGSSSRRSGGEHSKGSSRSRVLHSVMSPVPMKRSASSGRFCFTSQARGKNAVLPI